MENQRQQILTRLGKLNEITFSPPTAMDLRSSRPLLGRVERQNIASQKKAIAMQTSFLKGELGRIDSYSASVKHNEDYLKRKKSFEDKQMMKPKKDNGKAIRAVFSEKVPNVLSMPNITLGSMPSRSGTRLGLYKQKHQRSRR